jgi:hypothetical protein
MPYLRRNVLYRVQYVVIKTDMIISDSQIVKFITKYYKNLTEISLLYIYHRRMNVKNPYLKLPCSMFDFPCIIS